MPQKHISSEQNVFCSTGCCCLMFVCMLIATPVYGYLSICLYALLAAYFCYWISLIIVVVILLHVLPKSLFLSLFLSVYLSIVTIFLQFLFFFGPVHIHKTTAVSGFWGMEVEILCKVITVAFTVTAGFLWISFGLNDDQRCQNIFEFQERISNKLYTYVHRLTYVTIINCTTFVVRAETVKIELVTWKHNKKCNTVLWYSGLCLSWRVYYTIISC